VGTRIQMRSVSAGGTESALASIDIPKNGNLVGVTWQLQGSLDTTLDSSWWQLSFGSVIADVNDSRQVISNAVLGIVVLVTSGIYQGMVNYHDPVPDIQVGAGERLFLHSLATAATVVTVRCMVSFDFDLDLPRARRR